MRPRLARLGAVLAASLLTGGIARAGDTDLERVDRLLDGLSSALTRLDDVERTLDERAGRARLAAPPPQVRDGWQSVHGLLVPLRGRFPHPYKIVESGPPNGTRVNVAGMFLLRQSGAPDWMDSAELRAEAGPFDRAGGALPSDVRLTLVVRSREHRVRLDVARSVVSGWSVRSRREALSSGPVPLWGETSRQGVVAIGLVNATYPLPTAQFLAWLQGSAEDVGFGGGALHCVAKPLVLSALRDFASRLVARP